MRILLFLLALISLLAACTIGYSSRSNAPYQSALSDVPPSFYDGDPAMRDWYTFPYWPDRGP